MTKTLTIRDEVYKKLVSIKEDDESFSQLFERLAEGKSPADLLKNLRGIIEFKKDDKRKMRDEIDRRREERRT